MSTPSLPTRRPPARRISLARRWILQLRHWRTELQAQRAWRNALRAEDFTDWDSLQNRRNFALFPPDDVNGCREDVALQSRQDAAAARRRYEARSRPCFGCGRDASHLQWLFFESPDWTWTMRCGRAGWMVYCPECDNQVCFHRTRMS